MSIYVYPGKIQIEGRFSSVHDYSNGRAPLLAFGHIEYDEYREESFSVIVKNPEDYRGPVVKREDEDWTVGVLSDGTLIYWKIIGRGKYDRYIVTKDFKEFRYLEEGEFIKKGWDELPSKRPWKKIQVIPGERKILLSNGDEIKMSENVEITEIEPGKYKLTQKTSGFSTVIDTEYDTDGSVADKLQEAAMLYYSITGLYQRFSAYALPILSNYKGDWLTVLQKLFSITVKEHVNNPISPIRVDRIGKRIKAPQGTITIRAWPADKETENAANRAIAMFFQGELNSITIDEHKVTFSEEHNDVLRVKKDKKTVYVFEDEEYVVGKTHYKVYSIAIEDRDENSDYSPRFIPSWAIQRVKEFEDLSDVDWRFGIWHGKEKDAEVLYNSGTIDFIVPYCDTVTEYIPLDFDINDVHRKHTRTFSYIDEFSISFCLKDIKEFRKAGDDWVIRSTGGTELYLWKKKRLDVTYSIYYEGRELTSDEWEMLKETECIDSIVLAHL